MRGFTRTTLLGGVAGLLLLAGCGSDDDGASAGATGGKSSGPVAMITSGSHTDSSWVQSWWQGNRDAAEQLGGKTEVTWTDGLNSLDALDRASGAALVGGARALLISTSEAPQLVDKYAEKFPDAWVCDIEPPRAEYAKNTCTMFPRFHEGAFLAGALAGLTTKTDEVAAVAAFDIPIQNLQVEAFALGARHTNPDVEVARSTTDSLIDAGKARAATQAVLSGGADVVLSAVDDATRGVFVAAKGRGLVIPQYTDQYEAAPDVVLSSVLYRQDRISARMIADAAAGKLEPRSYAFGLKELGVGQLAPFRGAPGERVDDAARARLKELEAAIVSGELKLPEVDALTKRGAGDEIDPRSLGGPAA